jgi:ribonuclease T1
MAGGGRMKTAALAVLLVALAAAAVACGLWGTDSRSDAAPSPVAGGPGSPALPAISRSDLPPEARTTLDRIAAGGPFPFTADGTTFENRERLLPLRPFGTYSEYTVQTPGSADRGARRIVAAASGELYWTADHYASFARILP